MKSPVPSDRTLNLRSWGEVFALGFMGAIGFLLAVNYPSFYSNAKDPLFDAKAYWLAGQEDWIPYSLPPGALNAYLYSPAFQQVISLVSWLPWPAFAVLWVSAEAAVFVWLLRPLGWAWGIVLFLWCIPELYIGNIYAFLAAAAVLSLTGFPQAWALPILTKPALVVGVLWHPFRREWRSLAIAVGSTFAITTISYLLSPGLWVAWFGFLLDSAGGADPSYRWRVLGAAVVVVGGALAGVRWLVPIGMALALPVVGGISALTILAAIPRLVGIASASPATEIENHSEAAR